jgi:hypothetical protein
VAHRSLWRDAVEASTQVRAEPDRAVSAEDRGSVRGRTRGLAVLVTAAVVVGSIAVPLVLSQLNAEPARHARGQPAQPSVGGNAPSLHITAKPAVRVGGPPPERPLSIELQNRARVHVEPARTLSDGSLGVPRNIDHAGWWSGGARLGDQFGAIVIGAHVDSTVQGLGPFAELLDSRRGDRILVRSKHLAQAFAVTDVALVAKSRPKQVAAQFSGRGPGRLVLITCAGPYIRSRGGYQNIVVIIAHPLAPARKR